MNFKTLVFILLSLLFVCDAAVSQNGKLKETVSPPPAPEKKDDGLDAEEIIEMNKPALVSVWYHTDSYTDYYYYGLPKDTVMLSGSGFIFDKNGFVGTNYHVIDGFDSLFIKTSDSVFYNAELVFVDEKNDIAILKITNPEGKIFPFVKRGNSDILKTGQSVFAIGSPLGFEYTISEGIIAAIRDNEKVTFNDPSTYMPVEKTFDRVVQITAAISPGNSGGALFNNKGDIIGITTYSYGFYGNLNFAVAINTFYRLIDNIDFEKIDENEDFLARKRENMFTVNYRLAENFKTKLYSSWFYTKQKDTMKVYDTMVVKQDSLNRIYFRKSEQYYESCISMRPDSFYVYSGLMDLYIYTENFAKAEDFYGVIREKFSSDSLLNTFSNSLASAYSTSKDYKKALGFYEKIYAKDTNDIYVLYQIADLYDKQKMTKKAEDTYMKILRRDENYIIGYVQLGRMYFEKKDYKAAKKYFDMATEKIFLEEYSYGNYIDLYYYKGLLAVREGRKLEAMMNYIDMKNTYTYTKEENEKKLKLYKAILKMEE
jgi:tetratricopeptide (TPR) repeat protein